MLRTVIAIAAAKNLEMRQLDVKTAFFNGDIDEELFMAQPTGFVDHEKPELVCRLRRSLYGLKQASRAWNAKFNGFLVQYGLHRSVADPYIYSQEKDGVFTMLAIWVDDGIICSTHQAKLNDIIGDVFFDVN